MLRTLAVQVLSIYQIIGNLTWGTCNLISLIKNIYITDMTFKTWR